MWWRRSRIVYIDVRWMFVKILAAVMIFIALTSYWKWTRVTVIEFEAPEMEAAWKVSDNKVIAAVKKGIGEPVNSQTTPPVKGVIIMKLVSIRETRQYLFTEPGQVFDPKNNVMLQTKDSLNEILRRAVVELRSRSPFGEIIIWDEVDNILQIGDKATVIDLDSGENFKVRRTGGISHARVEPLTGNDSTAARKVYGGKWSWKRRAVVVETRGRKIAASLTGMPQGKGELTDNDCYGSLGLYFAGESTEKSPNISHLVK